MRTKQEILSKARDDIQNPKYNEQAPLCLEYRKIEVLIDIRDILDNKLDASLAIQKFMDGEN